MRDPPLTSQIPPAAQEVTEGAVPRCTGQEGSGRGAEPQPLAEGERGDRGASGVMGMVFATSHNPTPESFDRPVRVTLKT